MIGDRYCLMAVILFLVCGCRPVEEKDEMSSSDGPGAFEWSHDTHISASSSPLATEAVAVSPNEGLCRDKAYVIAGDKMQLRVSGLLRSFMDEGKIRLLPVEEKYKFRELLMTAEILSMEHVKVILFQKSENEKSFKCDIRLGLDPEKFRRTVNEVFSHVPFFLEEIQGSEGYQSILSGADKTGWDL